MRKPEQGRLRHGRGKLAAEHWSRTIRGRFPRERDHRKGPAPPDSGEPEGFGRLALSAAWCRTITFSIGARGET
jgi:hypothetical protein